MTSQLSWSAKTWSVREFWTDLTGELWSRELWSGELWSCDLWLEELWLGESWSAVSGDLVRCVVNMWAMVSRVVVRVVLVKRFVFRRFVVRRSLQLRSKSFPKDNFLILLKSGLSLSMSVVDFEREDKLDLSCWFWNQNLTFHINSCLWNESGEKNRRLKRTQKVVWNRIRETKTWIQREQIGESE